ncbi:MAG: hypothetical protein Q9187_001058 [Circinaria calcarea]
MSHTQKPVIGAEVCSPSTPQRPRLCLQKSSTYISPAQSLIPSQAVTPTEEYDPDTSHPFSPFYSHPTTRTSFEQHKCESKTNIQIYEKDLEAGSTPHIRQSSEPPRSVKECTVWPGRHQLLEKSHEMERSKGCSPLRRLNKKQKTWVKILIAMMIVGAAVGIGVGVSKAVGAGVWKNINSRTMIGHDHS